MAHAVIAVEGAPYGTDDSLALSVASMVVGSWERTHTAGANLASRLASANGQVEMCHNFESFYHKYSDTGLWSVLDYQSIIFGGEGGIYISSHILPYVTT